MQRVSAWSDLVAPGGQFRYGSLPLGVAPTPLKAEWLNALQEELAHFILAYLPALDKNDNTQLFQAIQRFGTTYALKATTLAGYGILDAYTKAQTDSMISAKANWGITLAAYGIGDAYTKTAVDGLLAGKADNATTLGGYGISDAYTKTLIDAALATKANTATTLAGYGITDPIWTDGNASPKAILAQASAAIGGVGTYALMTNRSGVALSPGQVAAGGSLTYANTEDVVQSGGTASGTWRCMGFAAANTNDQGTTLFLRIS